MKRKLKREVIIVGSIFIALIVMIFLMLPKEIYVFDLESNKKIALNNSFDKEIVTACYGSKLFYNFSPCYDITDEIKIIGDVNSEKLGNYVIIYSIDYKGIKKNYNQFVKVIDDQKPVIDFLGSNEVLMCPNKTINEPEFTAYDNQDGDITEKVQRKIKNNEYVYRVEDSAGNITELSRVINYIDDINPTLELIGDLDMNIALKSNFTDPGYIVKDNCNDNLSELVIVEGEVNTNKEDVYLLKYSVTDDSGNFATAMRRVIVGDPYINNEKKMVFLTFDDGPGPYTNDILDVLKEYDVKATFFVTGQFRKYSSIMKRMSDEGHTIGVHTYSHVFKKIYASEDSFFEDIDKLNEVIKTETGNYSEILRFAGGSSNTTSYFNRGIMTKLTKSVQEKGYVYFDWNVDSQDTKYSTSSIIANNVINSLKSKKNYFVVLQHDTKKANVLATRLIIEDSLKRGYIFKPLTKSSPKVHHGINN